MLGILRKTASGVGYCIKTKRFDFIALVSMAFAIPVIAVTAIQLFMGVDLPMNTYAHPYILTIFSFYLSIALLKGLQIQYREVEGDDEVADFISNNGNNTLCGIMLSVLLLLGFLKYDASVFILFFAVLIPTYQAAKIGRFYLMKQNSNLETT